MSRVFVLCMLVVQVIVFLTLRGQIKDRITFAFWKFFDKHKVLIMYLGTINIITYATFAVEKLMRLSIDRELKLYHCLD